MAKKYLRYTAEKGERKLKCHFKRPSPFQLSFNIHRFTSPYFPSIALPDRETRVSLGGGGD